MVQDGGAGAWGLADDVFQQRYQAGVSHTEGVWRPLPRVPLALHPPAAASVSGRRAPAAGTAPPRPGAAAAPPQLEPWLLAAGAAAEGGGGWQASARSTRARLLFQYKPYCRQEPLALEQDEVAAVVEAVFGRPPGAPPGAFHDPAALWGSGGGPLGLGGASTGEVAAVVLVKLVADLYLAAGPRNAFPLVLSLLQRPVLAGEPGGQARAFDLLHNLSVHGELLFEAAGGAPPDDEPALAEAVAELGGGDGHGNGQLNWRATVTSAFRATLAATVKAAGGPPVGANPRSSLDGRSNRSSVDGRGGRGSVDGRGCRGGAAAEWPPLLGARPAARCPRGERFQQWLRLLLFQLLAALAAAGGAGEAAWVAALSCLLHLCAHDGRLVRAYAEELPLPVVAALLQQCRRHLWSEQLHGWLTVLAANLLYRHGDDADERGMQRSVKAPSLSESLRSVGGGGWAGTGTGGGPDPAWWAGTHLDFERLAGFGGVRHVLRCYREAPTAQARRSMFAVLFDYVAAGQKPSGQDAWAPALMQPAHPSEALALGAALMRMGAAEALHPLFLAGVPGSMQPLAHAICVQMAALQEANPGRVVAVPGALVAECLECLEELAASEAQVPPPLQDAVRATLEAVAAPEGVAGSPPPAAAAAWGCLADCMRDPSELGSRAGRGWLLQLLVAAADHELSRAGSPPGGAEPPAGQPRGQPPPPPALLPEVSSHGGCQLQPGRRGMRGANALRELLMRALATTPDSRAADCFMAAVGSLLAHIRLRCAAASWGGSNAGDDGWGGSNGAAATPAPAPSLRAVGSAPRLAPGSAAQHSRLSGAGPSADSLAGGADGVGAAANASDSASLKSANSSPFEAAGGWQALDPAEVIISTLSLAVEWLLQAPQEARQGAMLAATQLLLALTLTPPTQPAGGRGGGAPGGLEHAPPATPSSAARPGAHWLAAQAPASPAVSPAVGGGPLSPGVLVQRPVSPSLAALHAAAAASAPSPAQPPGTPRTASVERLADGDTVTAADVAGLAPATAGGATGDDGLDAAVAAAEASATVLWSFLHGRAMVPQELLRLMPPLLLRTLFDDLRPDASALHYDTLAAAGAGASAARLARAADEALGVKTAVQSDSPLWDARAAVLLLLMGRCAHDAAALCALGGPPFFTALLAEPDVRVRHYAAVFVLRQLMLQQPLQYRRALRGVVARAQSANDERLLANPWLQLRAMLDQGSVRLESL